MGPHVGTVVGHVEGQVTEHLHARALGLLAQLQPLALELPLEQFFRQEPAGLLRRDPAQGLALTPGQGLGPHPPGLAPLEAPNHHEKGVVGQPAPLAAAPAGEGLLLLGRLRRPAAGQGFPHGLAAGRHGVQIQAACPSGRPRQHLQVGPLQKALLYQLLAVEQPGVEGRATGGAVGGAGAVGGGQGQQLPNPDAVAAEQGQPVLAGLAKAAAAPGARQGRGMEQYAGTTQVGGLHVFGSR